MNKNLKELKKNKYTTIAIIVFFVLIILGFVLYKFLFPNQGKPVYGNRLDGIENVAISTNDLKDLDEKLSSNDKVVKSKSDLKGRTVNVILTVKKQTSVNDAKALTSAVTKEFDKEQLSYFDFQVFIVSESEEDKGYPIIGYKSKVNDSFSFSNAN